MKTSLKVSRSKLYQSPSLHPPRLLSPLRPAQPSPRQARRKRNGWLELRRSLQHQRQRPPSQRSLRRYALLPWGDCENIDDNGTLGEFVPSPFASLLDFKTPGSHSRACILTAIPKVMRVPGKITETTIEGSKSVIEQLFEPCSSSHAIGYPHLKTKFQCGSCAFATFDWDSLVKHTKECLAKEDTVVICTKANRNE